VEAARSEPPRPTTRTGLTTASPSHEPRYLSVRCAVVACLVVPVGGDGTRWRRLRV